MMAGHEGRNARLWIERCSPGRTMPEMGGRTPGKDAATLLALIALVVGPTILTLISIEVPTERVPTTTDPSPLGYTWSLSLFVVPALVLATWFLRHPRYPTQRKAFWLTAIPLSLLGIGLDVVLGHLFFEFPNTGATLGIDIPVVGGTVPGEEFVFYVSGFVTTLLLYIWCDEHWLGAYNVPDYEAEYRQQGHTRVLRFHWPSLLIGIAAVVAAVAYKKLLSPAPEGFPGYFTFLMFVAVMPSMVLYPTALPFVNWRAVSVVFFVLVLISLLWEVTLAHPYQWWAFRPEQMIGLFIGGWTNLPVEEPLLWMVVTYTTVIVYETVKIVLSLDKPWLESLLGARR